MQRVKTMSMEGLRVKVHRLQGDFKVIFFVFQYDDNGTSAEILIFSINCGGLSVAHGGR